VLWVAANYHGASAFSFVWRPDPALAAGGELKLNRLDKVSDEDIGQAFSQIAERSNGAIAFRTLPWRHRASPLPRQAVDPGDLAARRVEHRVLPAERTESFSGLTRHAHDAQEAAMAALDAPSGIEPDEQARDHDEDAPELALGEPTPGASEPVVLLDFPRGPRAGNFFHSIFESIDFESATGEDLLEVATEKFESFGFAEQFAGSERDRLLASAVRAVGEALDTPLASLDFRLADVASERRFVELEFRVPVAQAGTRASASPERLAAVFRDHPSAAVPASYADRLEKLGFASLRGFLKGYIDLVFSHGGRWYVVDYKTNHLGDTLGDYDISRMTREMERSHYFLQYHLYTLAVDRFLRRAEPKYDYEKGFGGVLYLFIKGMRPGERTGLFFEKPPISRLHALGSLLDGGAP
jgi:exodeoxyribonuclease V beta subunit